MRGKIYRGTCVTTIDGSVSNWKVTVNGKPLSITPSLKLWNHSPTGFAWGYGGSGPAQLALAILLDYYGDKETAVRLHQPFKWATISHWPREGSWMLTGEEIETICRQLGPTKDSDD